MFFYIYIGSRIKCGMTNRCPFFILPPFPSSSSRPWAGIHVFCFCVCTLDPASSAGWREGGLWRGGNNPDTFQSNPLSTAVPRFLQPCLTRCRRLSELLSGDLYLYIIRQSTEHMFTNSVSNAFRRGCFPPIPSIYFKFSGGQKEAFLLQKNDFFKKDCSLALNFLERMFGINFKSLYLHSASVRNVKTHGKWWERVLTPLEVKKTNNATYRKDGQR